jgi:hypothetical protein
MLSLMIFRPLYGLAVAVDGLRQSFYALFALVQEAHATAARFEELAQMSDAELARRGLKREGLAQAVFTATAEA